MLSLPVWECGLKFKRLKGCPLLQCVTPCVGVWIEIEDKGGMGAEEIVTPCVGVWIEITMRILQG